MMKRLISILVLVVAPASMSWAQSDQRSASDTCSPLDQKYVSTPYLDDVWRYVLPGEVRGSLIVLSVSVNADSKLVLRARDDETFELLRATPRQPLFSTLDGLARACRLPFDPYQAAKLVPVRWERVALNPARFAALHRAFTTGFSEYLKDAQTRYPSVLARGGRVVFHSTVFYVAYDNCGYEHVDAALENVANENGKAGALLSWVHELLALADRSFRK
jgi:hypothetical protein